MAAEYAWQRAHPVEPGTRAGDYQLADTVASLSMGVGGRDGRTPVARPPGSPDAPQLVARRQLSISG